MYESLKLVHMSAAAVSIGGFLLRAYWMLRSSALLTHRWVKVLPHVVDTILLLSGVGLLLLLKLPFAQSSWLHVKLTALVVYIVLGSIALKRGRTKRSRAIAAALAIATYLYIVGVALSKSADSWLPVLAR